MNTGIYLHIPFCRQKCDYCSFYSVPKTFSGDFASAIDQYVEALIREVNARLPLLQDTVVDTVYFGGGTPSLLSAAHVARILSAIKQHVVITEAVEISLEMNPEDMLVPYISSLQDVGVNRIVLGVQTIDFEAWNAIGRSSCLCGPELIEQFCAIPELTHCVDIIGAIPGYNIDRYMIDLQQIVRNDIQHVSVYLLSIDNGTPLAERGLKSLTDEKVIAVYKETVRLLSDNSFAHYEISNFARDGYVSLHNMKYWTYQPYIGLGAGAHSFYNRKRYINNMNVGEYLSAQDVVLNEDKRTLNGEIIEYFLTGLRLLKGISLDDMKHIFEVQLPDTVCQVFSSLEKRGLICFEAGNGGRLSLSEHGLLVADSVIYEIVDPLL